MGLVMRTVCLTFMLMLPAQLFAAETVTLQLKWRHAFQFAGFYMAVEKGYYRDEGLDVTLIEGGPGKNPIDAVLPAEGHYGITDTGVLLARADGKAVKVLAPIFQHSPLALAVLKRSGIKGIRDLRDRRVMMQSGHMDAVILAAMKKSGLMQGDFIRQDTSFDITDLIQGRTDAFSIYTTDQPHQLDELGIPYRILHPNDYGIDFYGDILITSDREAARHPERTAAMIRASMKGWRYALDHLDETVNLIISKYNTQPLSRNQLYHEAVKTGELILKDVVAMGYMSEERWQKIADTYKALALIPEAFSIEGMLYTPRASLSSLISGYSWQLAVSALILLLLIISLQMLLLKRMVATRTRALTISERRFRTLVDNIPGAVFRCNLGDGCRMLFISHEIEQICGYQTSEFLDGRGLSYRKLIHEDDRPQSHEIIQSALGRGSSYNIEYRIRHQDGSLRWVNEIGQVAEASTNGKPMIDGCIFDISAQKRSEELRAATANILEMITNDYPLSDILHTLVAVYEERYPQMMASILLLRDNRLWQGAAPSLPDSYNRAVEGVEIGHGVGSCGTAAFTRQRVIVEDIASNPLWSPYCKLASQHGLAACWSEPILDSSGEVLGTFAMYYDHARKPDSKEIEDIEAGARLAAIAIERHRFTDRLKKLSGAIEQASEVVTITNYDGEIEYVNPAFTRVTGYSNSEAIGETPALFRDEEYGALAEKIRATIQAGGIWRGKVVEKKKDGTTYPAMLTISPIRNQENEITHFIGMHEDMSELQSLEEQFYQAQKMEAIGTLVGGIAHDFNNMLAGMTGNIYLAKRMIDGDSRANEKLDHVQTLIARAADIIKQLLAFARRDMTEMKSIQLTPFLKETFKLHYSSVPENVDLQLNIDSDLQVLADITQLQQVLLNLLTNARDAVAEAENPKIVVSLDHYTPDHAFVEKHPQAQLHGYAHLSVRDNGHGIPKECLSSIFEPFFTTKPVGKGTGLGLSMVFGTVHSHDGIIEVESDEQVGSCFHIYLPLTDDLPDREEEPQEQPVIHGDNITILLVDDEEDVRTIIGEVLENLGYNILIAEHGQQALELFREQPDQIDLLLTDVVMPKMGGLQLAREVLKLKPGLPIIYATGYDKQQELEHEAEQENIGVLAKPYSVELLGKTVQQLLGDTTSKRR